MRSNPKGMNDGRAFGTMSALDGRFVGVLLGATAFVIGRDPSRFRFESVECIKAARTEDSCSV